MSQTEKGVLIFSEWFEAMKDLKVTEFKSMMYAIYRLQILGEEPPEFQGKAGIIASFIFPMIKRRMELSEYGSRGAAKRLAVDVTEGTKDTSNEESASSHPSSPDPSEDSTQASSLPEATLQTKEKNRKEKNRIAYSPSSESSKGEAREARTTRTARGVRAAKSEKSEKDAKDEKDEFYDEFFEAAIKRALGENA